MTNILMCMLMDSLALNGIVVKGPHQLSALTGVLTSCLIGPHLCVGVTEASLMLLFNMLLQDNLQLYLAKKFSLVFDLLLLISFFCCVTFIPFKAHQIQIH